MSEKKYSLQELLDLKDLGSLGEAYRRVKDSRKQVLHQDVEMTYREIVPSVPCQNTQPMKKFSMVDFSQEVSCKTSTA